MMTGDSPCVCLAASPEWEAVSFMQIRITVALAVLAASAIVLLGLRQIATRLLIRGGYPASGPAFVVIERGFGRLAAKRRALTVILVAFMALFLRGALTPLLGIPVPGSADEFSYLLAADTFAHGRLTNPTPPLWMHFESLHILVHPTYMSMYPPAQGLVLALGQVLGNPWIGVWISVAAMAGALCWMLQAWVPPGWALLGGMLCVINLGVLSYWANSYWGGAVAATGGALVLGALPRILRWTRLRDALTMGVGLALLANSRMYEGFAFSIPVAVALIAWWLRRDQQARRIVLRRVGLPLFLVLLATFSGMGYYWWRVTGNPWHPPELVNRETYAIMPVFVWQSLSTNRPIYHNQQMREFYLHVEPTDFLDSKAHFVRFTVEKAVTYWKFYSAYLLSIPFFLSLPWIIRDKKLKWVLVVLAVGGVAVAAEMWIMPHYVAPFTSALYLLFIQGMRHLRAVDKKYRKLGRALVRAVPVGCLMVLLWRVAAIGIGLPEGRWHNGNWPRALITRELRSQPGTHLVLVHYAADHNPIIEWVYNRADVDTAKIVWARSLGPQKDLDLLRYFHERCVWTLDADAPHPELSLYGMAANRRCALPPTHTGKSR